MRSLRTPSTSPFNRCSGLIAPPTTARRACRLQLAARLARLAVELPARQDLQEVLGVLLLRPRLAHAQIERLDALVVGRAQRLAPGRAVVLEPLEPGGHRLDVRAAHL